MPEKVKDPKWFTMEAYDRAIVSFGDRVEGVSVVLGDCTTEDGEEIKKQIVRKENGDVDITLNAIAAMAKAHVVEVVGEKKGGIFPTDKPAPKANLGDWVKWLSAMKQKNFNRLRDAIIHFRVREVDEGNE